MTDKKENLIIFDWNGTLLADTTACLRAMNTVLKALGSPPITRAQYQKHYAMPLDKLYYGVGVTPEVLRMNEKIIHSIWHEVYSSTPIRMRRGAKKMLQTVRKTSCTSIVLSNYIEDRIKEQAERFGVRQHFDDVIAFRLGDATFRTSGKSGRLKKYLQNRPAREGIIIGDTEEEIEIGRDLGMVTIAITDGMCSTSRLRAMKPDFMVGALGQVPAIVSNVFGKKTRRS
jgi:phosphoglycolate phosphatase